MRDAQAEDPLAPIAVLIGGTLQRPYLQRRLADLNDGLANVHFLTVADFALKLGERRMVLDGRQPLPPLADRILLHEVSVDTGGYFEPVRETPGLADALHRLVRELRGAGYDGERLRTAIADACEVPEKAASIAEIYDDFLRRRTDFYGPDDCLIEADGDASPWTHLFCFGLWEASAELRRVLASVSRHVPLAVYLPTTGTHADETHRELRDWLEELGAEAEELPAEEPRDALSAVKGQLFSTEQQAVRKDHSLRLLSAPDATREVREVARACMRWARDGIRFHEMAIAYRSPDPYRATIESVFAEAGIPVYLHEGTPLSERPLGRRALALLDLAESDLERRLVIDFLSDVLLPDATRETYDSPSVTRWDRISREAGVVKGIEQWDQRLSAHAEEMLASDREWRRENAARAESLLAFVRDLAEAFGAQPEVGTWSEQLAALRTLFETYIKDCQPIFDALEGLERFDALDESVPAGRFRDTVRSAIENLRSDDVAGNRAGAFGLRGVNVLDANSLRHLGFRAVAIVGLVERAFPPPPRPDPILLDHEREQLNARGHAAIPLRVMGPDPEPLQFAVAVGAARERLLATHPRKGGGSGRAQLPSSLFRALAEAATGERVTAQDIDGKLPADLYTHARGTRIGAEQPTEALSRSEYDRSLIESDRDLGRALLIADEPRIGAAFDARRARFGRSLTPFDGVLRANAIEYLSRLGLLERSWGPSGLETYAKCPQRFFLGSVIRAKRTEEPEEAAQINPLNRGSLIHLILERFLSGSPADGEEIVYGEGEQARLLAIADEACHECEERGETGYPLLWQYDRANLREDLVRWLENERKDPELRKLTEGDYEVRFASWAGGGSEGRLSSDEPLEVSANGATLRVGGKIDRLNWDEARTRFRVVDYKTGKVGKDSKDSKLVGGRAVQLPLYVLAAARLLGIPAERGTAEYHYATRKGGFQRRRFTAEDMRNRSDDLDLILATIAGGIEGGRFQMNPPTPRDCKYCDFNQICPAARHRQIERKADDPVARSFAAMREVE